MSIVTQDIGSQVSVDTIRAMLEFTSFFMRCYQALEFADKSLTEQGIILSIDEAYRKLTESGRDTMSAQVALTLSAEQMQNDARKNLDVAWGVLSRKLCRACKFALDMTDVGVYDLTFSRALDLLELSNEHRKKAMLKYINFKAADQACNLPSPQNPTIPSEMSIVTEDIGSKVSVDTNRVMLEFTSVFNRFYEALEFAHKSLTEQGVILSIDEADKKLTESGRDFIRAQVALIPLARTAEPMKNDARKNLDVAWGVLSKKLCCAHKFALDMINVGGYDLTFSMALDLIELSNEDRKKALFKAADQACNLQSRQNPTIPSETAIVTEDIGSKVSVDTNRVMLEFTSVFDRFYEALEFAHKSLTEQGVILSIDEADKKLTESGRDVIRAQVALIPLARTAEPMKNDARKNLDVAWGVLSRKLCCAHKFALDMINVGGYDLTFSRALDLIELSNEDRKKAMLKYILFKAADQACNLPSPQNMINGKHPVEGEYGEHFPKTPSCFHFQMFYLVSRMMTPDMDKDPAIRAPYNRYPLVIMSPGVAELTREFGWQLRAPHWYGEEIMDCFSMLLNLEQHALDGGKKTWFWSSTLSPLSSIEIVQTIDERWAGKWDEMDTIALPINNTRQSHYFLMVISFDSKKVYILGSGPSWDYPDEDAVFPKIEFIHACMNESFSEYRGNYNITQWPQMWPDLQLPKLKNPMDSGAYVCFFMERLRDLIATPVLQRRIFVSEENLRIWVAQRICLSPYNKVKQNLIEELKKSPEFQ